ncbi:hypothetical protein BH09MYX1_BH09MYX1_01600 [soil metagenome]
MQTGVGFFGSSIGKKVVMAVTGVLLVSFVVAHMIGNLQLYLPAHDGVPALDAYGTFLHTFLHGGGIWLARGSLLLAVALHIWAAVTLFRTNVAARPIGYQKLAPVASTLSSRWMRLTGPIVLIFVVYHLLHFTLGAVHPAFEPGHVFHNVVTGFQVPWVAGFYIVAMLALGSHLSHGIWSMLQTLGLSHPRYNALRKGLATLLTVVVIGFNVSFPIAVLAGLVR